MRLASGIAPVMKYRRAGVKVGIGVDGSASNDGNNMLGEVRQAMLLARLQIGLRPPEGPDTALSTLGHESRRGMDDRPPGARARHPWAALRCWGATTSARSPWASSAISSPSISTAWPMPAPWPIRWRRPCFCAPQTARHTVVAGRPVVRDGRIVTIDLERTPLTSP
jgi:8-oxoguanine deaminase